MGKTNLKGDEAELKVAARFLELGNWVSFPVGDDAPYDIIVDDKNGSIKRVQIKYITEKNSVLQLRLQSSTKTSYKDTIDLMAIYSPTAGIFVVNPHELPVETMICLRLSPTKSGRIKDVWLAEKYRL